LFLWNVLKTIKKNSTKMFSPVIAVCHFINYMRDNIMGHCGRMVVGFATTCAISSYLHWSWEFESHSWWGVLNTTLCNQVCQWLVAGWWFSPPSTPVSSTSKTDHNITEISLKVALNTINQPIKMKDNLRNVQLYTIMYTRFIAYFSE
jgi:hypothetical protein